MATLEIDKMEYPSDGTAQAAYVSDAPANLQSYSENTIKTQGDYSLKVVADTSSQGKILSHSVSPISDLTGVKNLKFDIRSNLTGENVKLALYSGARPSGGTMTTDEYDTLTDLSLHYKMNDDAASTTVIDDSSSNNDGTCTANTDTISVAGKINTALNFTGSDYITLGTPVTFGTNATINFWVKDFSSGSQVAGRGSVNVGYVLYWYPGDNNMYIGSNTNGEQIAWSTATLDFSGWHMFTIIKEGTDVTLYVDLDNKGLRPISTICDIYYIGKGASSYLNAGLDDFRIYDRVLSAKELEILYSKNTGTEDAIDQAPTSYIHIFTANGTFVVPQAIDVAALVIGSGGGGGAGSSSAGNGGGGGAGGVISSDSLIAHYKMNDNDSTTDVIDSSNNKYTGISSTTTDALTIAGKINEALDLNGTSEYITIPKVIDLTQPFSIAFWINPTNLLGYRRIFSQSGYASLYLDANRPVFFEGVSNISSLEVLGTGWKHIVFTSDGAGVYKFYIDGTQNTPTGTNLFSSQPDSFTISATDYPLNSSLDDFRVYNKVLSQEEVNTIYASGTGTENEIKYTLVAGTYTVEVGSGGVEGVSGDDTVFDGLTAIGGGAGGTYPAPNGQDGGSGGGAGQANTYGSGTTGQGYAGGTSGYAGGGGGGAGAVGQNAQDYGGNLEDGGNGGDGILVDMGYITAYAAGGGGGSTHYNGSKQSIGGKGGGGRGSFAGQSILATNGVDGLGGGGGGGGENYAGGTGGKGVVIIKYLIPEETLVTEITPNIAVADQFQTVNWDISAVADVDKVGIGSVKVEIVDDASANTFYLDNFEVAQAIDVVGLI